MILTFLAAFVFLSILVGYVRFGIWLADNDHGWLAAIWIIGGLSALITFVAHHP